MSKVEKKEKKVRRKSNCWLFYKKVDKGGICRLCKKEIISNGNTTNLLNHLKRKHTVQWEAAIEGNEDTMAISHMEFRSESEDQQEEISYRDERSNHHQTATMGETQHHLAFQSEDGGTLYFLQPSVQVEQMQTEFQPQITMVEHHSENAISEGATILATGEVIQNATASSTEGLSVDNSSENTTSEKPPEDLKSTETTTTTTTTTAVTSPKKTVVNQQHLKTPPANQIRIVRQMPGQGFPLKMVAHSVVNGAIGQNRAADSVCQSNGGSNNESREDSFDQFGKYIATLLRNLPSRRTACRLQKEMINWVLKEQMMYED